MNSHSNVGHHPFRLATADRGAACPVVSDFLKQATGIETLTVTFNGDNWVEIESVGQDVEVLLIWDTIDVSISAIYWWRKVARVFTFMYRQPSQ